MFHLPLAEPMYLHQPNPSLKDNQIDIWCAPFRDELEEEQFRSYRDLLTTEEIERCDRFAFEKDRKQFLLTRALERDVLSRYLGVGPALLVFNRNEYGKPHLAEPAACPIQFSLSHTTGLSVCAVTSEVDIGVDVESLDRPTSHWDIANRFFAASEAAYLKSVEEDHKGTEFLRLWTLKEAFVKARGLGFSIPLKSFTIRSTPGQPTRVSFVHGTHGTEADWRFFQIRLGSGFHIAVVLATPKSQNMVVKVSTLIPLAEECASITLEPNELNEWTLEEL